jgi:hypothetical protein
MSRSAPNELSIVDSSPVSSPNQSIHSNQSDCSDDSEPQTPTPEAGYGDPPRTVRELAAWFDGKVKGRLRLEVLAWDGRIVKVPMNELGDSCQAKYCAKTVKGKVQCCN